LNRPPKTVPEPEIIPPGQATSQSRIWISWQAPGSRGAYIRMPGPLAIALAILVFGILLGAILIILLGALLVWIPVTIVLVAALVVTARLRTGFRRFR
jgi:hypothetical protein